MAQGLGMLQQLMSSSSSKELSGAKAFELYDTFGFPIDLTALILSEHGMTLNEEDFQKEMDKQKARSRAASQTNSEDWVEVIEDEEQEFVGYNLLSTPVRIVRYRKITNKYGELYSWFSISLLFMLKGEVKLAIRDIWRHQMGM